MAYVTCGRYASPADAPESLARSASLFEQAHAHFDAGRYWEAADAFGAAAEILREGAQAHEAAVTRDRGVAYANMVLSLLNVDAVDEARARLTRAASRDQPLHDDLESAAAALPSPPHCDLGKSP